MYDGIPKEFCNISHIIVGVSVLDLAGLIL